MVTFSCDNCNDTVKKSKANQHAQRCRGSLTCIDCSKTFWSGEWNAHNACISEAEAYQGALYKPTKKELKRKAAEIAAEQAKSRHATPDVAPQSSATTSKLPKPEEKSVQKEKKRSKPESKEESKTIEDSQQSAKTIESKADNGRQNLALLHSVVPEGQSISIHKALKLLKAQNKLDKDGEKALLKDVCIAKAADGQLHLV